MPKLVFRLIILPALAGCLIGAVSTRAGAQGTRAQAQPKAPAATPNAKAANAPQPNAPPANIDPTGQRMRIILNDWEAISSQLKTLEVSITRIDHADTWGDELYTGMAKLMSPNYAFLEFNKEVKDPKAPGGKKLVQHERIVCTGSEVWHYLCETTQIFIFPIDKKDQMHALEEGPLPFLFNLKADEASKRYQMELKKEDKDHYVIGVIPKLKIDQSGFSQAFIQLKKVNYIPERIMLVSPDGKGTKDFKLRLTANNQKIDPRYFQGKIFPKPWTVERDPKNAPGAGAANPAAPKAAAPGPGRAAQAAPPRPAPR